jgi:ribosomal protein S2
MIFHSANNLRKRKEKRKRKREKKKEKKKGKRKKKRKEGIKELKQKPHAIIVTWPYLSSMAKFFLNLMLID